MSKRPATMADPTQSVNLDEEVPPSTDPVVETAEYAMQPFFCSVLVYNSNPRSYD